MNWDNIQGRISSTFDLLSKSEQKIGRAILKNPAEIIHMTAKELSDYVGTSSATVIRFCKKIDVPSFTQLKIYLSAEIDLPSHEGYSDIPVNESIDKIKMKLLGNAYQSMRETVALLKEERIELVTDILVEASIIYVYGIGASYLVAENIAQKWNRVGKITMCLLDSHSLVTNLISAPKNAVFWGISHSGETKEILRLVDVAQKVGVKTVGLSQFGHNSLAKRVDYSLQTVRSNESVLRSAATTSLHDQFIVVDILFYSYVSRDVAQMSEKIQKSKDEVQNYENI